MMIIAGLGNLVFRVTLLMILFAFRLIAGNAN